MHYPSLAASYIILAARAYTHVCFAPACVWLCGVGWGVEMRLLSASTDGSTERRERE